MEWNALFLALAAVLAAFAGGFALGVLLTQKKATDGLTAAKLASVTRLYFVRILDWSIFWVTLSYLYAGYAMVRLGVVYTLEELSKPVVTGLLFSLFAKVLENAFEHNNGKIFGTSNKKTRSESDHVEDL